MSGWLAFLLGVISGGLTVFAWCLVAVSRMARDGQ